MTLVEEKQLAGCIDHTLLDAGAQRLGTSSGVQIVNEFRAGQLQ